MTTLPARFIEQRNTGPNGNNNCAPCALASAAFAYGITLDPQALHDAEYGAGHLGPTSPSRYADDTSDVLRQHGLSLRVVRLGDQNPDGTTLASEADLVARIHAENTAGHPVVIAIPSQWGNFSIPVFVRRTQQQPDGSWLPTHIVTIYDGWAGGLAAENSWGAFRHTFTDAGLAELLVLGELWIVLNSGQGGTAPVTDITPLYTVHADGSATFKATGAVIGSGFYAKAKELGIAAPPMYPHEIARPGAPGQTYMPFGGSGSEAVTLYYDGTQVLVDRWLGHGLVSLEQARDAAVTQAIQAAKDRDAARASLADMTAQRDAAKQAADAAQTQASQIQQQLARMTATEQGDQQQIGQLQAQVSQLQAQLANAQQAAQTPPMSQAAQDALAAVAALKKAESETA